MVNLHFCFKDYISNDIEHDNHFNKIYFSKQGLESMLMNSGRKQTMNNWPSEQRS